MEGHFKSFPVDCGRPVLLFSFSNGLLWRSSFFSISLPFPQRHLAPFRQRLFWSSIAYFTVSSTVEPSCTMPLVNVPDLVSRITISLDNTSRAPISLYPHCQLFCHMYHVLDSTYFRGNSRLRRRLICQMPTLDPSPLPPRLLIYFNSIINSKKTGNLFGFNYNFNGFSNLFRFNYDFL